MNETGLNIEYICKKTLLNKDNKLVPIILDLMQECYRAGLCQAEYDNTMNLIEENQELKQKYENAVADYETTMAEKEQLKKQLKDKMEDYRRMKDNFDSKVDVLTKIETQQKKFIKWLENGIEKVKNTEFLDERIQRAGLIAYNRVLSKYKEIIGDDK